MTSISYPRYHWTWYSIYSQSPILIHSFIHSGHFYSSPSSHLLLRGAPDYSTDTVSEFHAEAHGPYMAARAGVEPTTLRLKSVFSTKAPPCPTGATMSYECIWVRVASLISLLFSWTVYSRCPHCSWVGYEPQMEYSISKPFLSSQLERNSLFTRQLIDVDEDEWWR